MIVEVNWSIYKYNEEVKKAIKIESHKKIFEIEDKNYNLSSQNNCAEKVLYGEGLNFLKFPDAYGLFTKVYRDKDYLGMR